MKLFFFLMKSLTFLDDQCSSNVGKTRRGKEMKFEMSDHLPNLLVNNIFECNRMHS